MLDDTNVKAIQRGKEMFASISGEKPSLFNKAAWMGKVMDWSMRNENFKVQIFRFVDTFPSLTTPKLLTDHIKEYFGEEKDMPAFLSAGAKVAGMLGTFGGSVLNKVISGNIHEMAKQFIVGEKTHDALKNIVKLRKDGFAAVVDVLGEATLSHLEADEYVATYLELLDAMEKEQNSWKALGLDTKDSGDWGHAPKINVAIKPTATFCLANPQDFEGSVVGILNQARKVCQRAKEMNAFFCIDMESYKHKDITLEVYRRLKLEFKDYPHVGIVLQAYLKDAEKDTADLIAWARKHNTQISIRLVKGAYWDYEVVRAKQNGWEIPVWTIKSESDACFERITYNVLKNSDICHFACASHNVRSIAATIEIAKELGVDDSRYEFQVLYGMAEPVRRGILKVAGRVRLYCPYGDMVPGMGYLVRRLLENTANESFLRQSFVEEASLEKLLEDPELTVKREREEKAQSAKPKAKEQGFGPFRNEPMVDFTQQAARDVFPAEIAKIRSSALGKTYPLFINGKDVDTGDYIDTINPAKPSEVLGKVCQGGIAEVDMAIKAASDAFAAWRDTAPEERAKCLMKAAVIARRRMYELCAWQVLEVGKQWDQAQGDVAEGIDFLEYYAREMMRLAKPRRLGNAPGELNHYIYEPKGITAVIAPWNFPFAISIGMCSAALVVGNPVIYKPANITGIIGHQLAEIFQEAGIPAGVFNYVPGRGSVMGDYLVEHPQVSCIAFTGSMEVGLRIVEKAGKTSPTQVNVKKVISEMGGKNAIIIDDDADLDEVVPHVLYSAFAFQGQKCSACSRLIVTDTIYDKAVERLVEGAKALLIGPADDCTYAMGAVADAAAQKNVLDYIAIAESEGKLLYKSSVPEGEGYWAPITIVDGITPEHRIAQEEVFGPVLAIMRATDFDHAIELANSTRFALTGGVFSRSPKNLQKAREKFRVGNLYLNRNNTGALVERQPFGGAQMSGVGTKAGGPDYLLHFMDPRVITENTMRRGFAPVEEDDDWDA